MRRSDSAVLAAVGTASAALYFLLFAHPFPLVSLYAVRHMDLGKLTWYGQTEAVVFVGGLAGLFVLYLIALRLTARAEGDRRALAWVLGFALLYGVTLAATYPIGALDVFAYVFQGRILAHYHANPFVVAPASFPQDPVLPLLAWPSEPSTYGPLWVIVEGASALLYEDSLLAGLAVFKAMGVALHVLTAYAVFLVLKRQGAQAPVAGTLFFAWNPLMIFEAAANGHNDVAMACLALLAVYALAAGRVSLSYPLLMASALVKFVTLVLFPVFLMAWLYGREQVAIRARGAAVGLLLAGMLAAALYAPFWAGAETIGALKRGDLFTASPLAFAFFFLKDRGYADAGQTVRVGGSLLLLLFVVGRTLLVRQGSRHLLAASFDILMAYFALATFWFQPWYLVVLVPVAAALEDTTRRRLALVFTASAVLNYFVFDYLWFWYPHQLGILEVQAAAALAIYGPPVAFLLSVAGMRLAQAPAAPDLEPPR